MSFSAKYRIALLAVALAVVAAVPMAHAQTRAIQNILQLNTGGAYLGIQMEDVTSENMSRFKLSVERGVIVRSVVKGSPAEAANVKQDDVLLEFGGSQIWSAAQLSRLVQETPPGRKVELAISRDGKRMNLTAELADRQGKGVENRVMILRPEDFGDSLPEFWSRNMPDRTTNEPAGRKPRLGVTLQPLTDQLGEFLGVPNGKGALVASVASGSASAGKLKSGDVILAADGKKIDNPEDLTRFIREKTGGNVSLKVIRDKKETTVVINLPAEESETKGYKL
jgi:serine protease Do